MFLHTKAVDKCWMVFATLLVGIQNCWCRANLRHGRRPFNILWEYLWNVQLQLLVLVAPNTRRKVTLSLEWFVTVHNGLCADVLFFEEHFIWKFMVIIQYSKNLTKVLGNHNSASNKKFPSDMGNFHNEASSIRDQHIPIDYNIRLQFERLWHQSSKPKRLLRNTFQKWLCRNLVPIT